MNIKFSGFIPVERRNLMIKTEKESFDFPIDYLLTEEAVDKATDVLIDKFEDLGLIDSYWVNYCLYWFCKNHQDLFTQVFVLEQWSRQSSLFQRD